MVTTPVQLALVAGINVCCPIKMDIASAGGKKQTSKGLKIIAEADRTALPVAVFVGCSLPHEANLQEFHSSRNLRRHS